MRFLRSRRGLIAIAAVVLMLFLFRPGAHVLRHRIAGSIGSALGRRVALDNVRVHLLPRPGFDLEGLVIFDDPAFSAEPMMRAQEVSAAIRLRSLLRGRLEIATLSATEPSINLVRNDQGRWNLAGLLERSARIPTAPTGKAASEQRPAFPYLEASHARINFKIGQAKKSWALTDADVALWQDSENSWGARMKAQPVRTDFNLSDTGIFQVNATWQRAESMGDTPLQVEVLWDKGQLGQITKLFSGADRGWRGGMKFGANLSGTPRSLQVRSQVSIEDLRRYDIVGGGSVRLSTDCTARYSIADNILSDLLCESPVAGGAVRLQGTLGPIATSPAYDFTLTADRVPLPAVLQVLRHAKKGLPADLTADGLLDAEIHAARDSGRVHLRGQGTASSVRLSSNKGKDQISFGNIPLTVEAGSGDIKSRSAAYKVNRETEEDGLRVGPFPLALGAQAPATATAWVSAKGYRLSLRGDSEVNSLYRVANTLGLPGFHPVAEGQARVDVNVDGVWQGFAAPQIVGTVQVRNVRTGVRGLNPSIDIANALVKLDPETAVLEKITAQTGDTKWTGSVKAPRHCGPEGCPLQFDLVADQLSSGGLEQWFTPRPAKRPWYRILSSGDQQGKSPLLGLLAHGRLRIHRLGLQKVIANEVAAEVELDRGRITLSNVRGQVLEGSHQGDWVIDAATVPLHYRGTGKVQNISVSALSAAANDTWATGTADARFELESSGTTFTDLLSHADGELQFTLRNGTLPHLDLSDAAKPFPVHLLSGSLKAKSGVWTLSAGKLESHDGLYQASGTISPGTGMNLMLTRGDDQLWNITGTLLKPVVAHAMRTEARSVVNP